MAEDESPHERVVDAVLRGGHGEEVREGADPRRGQPEKRAKSPRNSQIVLNFNYMGRRHANHSHALVLLEAADGLLDVVVGELLLRLQQLLQSVCHDRDNVLGLLRVREAREQ